MKCNLKDREIFISGYLTGNLNVKDLLKFEEHYFQCEECFNELKAAEHAVTLIKTEGIAANKKNVHSENFINKLFIEIFTSPFKIGITVAAIMVAFLLYFVLSSSIKTKNENVLVDSKDSLSQKDDSLVIENDPGEEIFADLSAPEFQHNPYLEEWINDNTRSGEEEIEKIISPANGKIFSNTDPIFRWEMHEKIPVDITVFNNIEQTIFSKPIAPNQFPEYSVTVSLKSFSKSGLYYWKIEDMNEVKYIGKFYLFLKKD